MVVRAEEGELTLEFWLFLIPSLIIYTFATLWGIPKLGRWFFLLNLVMMIEPNSCSCWRLYLLFPI